MKPRCYLVVANAPEHLRLKEANAIFNKYIGDRKRGHCVYHDHFVDRPGGVAFLQSRMMNKRRILNRI